jgi:hypothetical protein
MNAPVRITPALTITPRTPVADILRILGQHGTKTREGLALDLLVEAFPADARSDDETKAWAEMMACIRDMWIARQDHFTDDLPENYADAICKPVCAIADMYEEGV